MKVTKDTPPRTDRPLLSTEGHTQHAETLRDDATAPACSEDSLAFEAILREAAHVTVAPKSVLERPLVGSTLGDGRFRVLRQIGRGGMGIVYEALDAERRCKVALKLLTRRSADSVYQLKNEFRGLVDLRHENLIGLHELFADEGYWFYTMTLFEGVPFDAFVRPKGVLSVTRLRACLVQLGRAVAAIHAAGKLHRDLKPSNVLVDAAGKLVVLDFGLAIDAHAGGVGRTRSEHMLCGTPAYMAPEQVAGRGAEAASDLYAIGVMLYETLAGRHPFEGTFGEIVAAKQRDDVRPPRAHDLSIPADLDALCTALLARDPAARPPVEALLDDPAPRTARATTASPLFGRAHELSLLRAAFAASQAGVGVVVSVVGESGIGKSALCEHFLRGLQDEQRLTVLRSRCNERESVPFKALDPLIDGIGRQLRRLSDADAARLMPPDYAALTRLFPTLTRVRAFSATPPIPDVTHETVSFRAVSALSTLLHNLRATCPLVLYLDDLQWADADSLLLLRKLLTDRAGFPALLIASHRQTGLRGGPLTSVLAAARDHDGLSVRRITLGPLAQAATVELVTAHWPDVPHDRASIDTAARESHGVPLFAAELARFRDRSMSPARTLEEVISARYRSLPESARRLLDLLALTAEPLLARVALEAAEASHEEIARLAEAHLVRVDRTHGKHGTGRTLECYHDRVRDCVIAQLDDATRRAYAMRLSQVLSKLDDASAELFRRVLVDAGEHERAAVLAIAAGDAAFEALAFERAAELYAQAGSFSADAATRRRLAEARADAIGSSARSGDAAEAYLAAAALTEGAHQHELRGKAAEALLYRGDFSEGIRLLETLCVDANVYFPRSLVHARAQRAIGLARLWARGLELAPKADASRAARLSIQHRLVNGVINYLPVHSSAASHDLLLTALDAGDAKAAFVGFGRCASSESRLATTQADRKRIDTYIAKMEAFLQPTGAGDAPLIAQSFASFTKGMVSSNYGEYRAARAHFRHAQRCAQPGFGMVALLEIAQIFLQRCAWVLGDFAELARETPVMVERNLAAGRAYSSVLLCGRAGMTAWLMRDDPDAALRRLDEVRRLWRTPAEPYYPDLQLLSGELTVLIYRGRHDAALALAEARAPTFERAHWARQNGVSYMSATLGHLAALHLRETRGRRRAELRTKVERALRAVVRGGAVFDGAHVPLALALALDRGDRAAAVHVLRERLGRADDANAHSAMLRLRLGELLGGDVGAALMRQGRGELAAQGVKNLDALVDLHLPSTH